MNDIKTIANINEFAEWARSEGLLKVEPLNLESINNTNVTTDYGVYAFIDNNTKAIKYIGSATGQKGLRKRVVQQHLNPTHIGSHNGKPIEISDFRKNLGRRHKLRSGDECLSFIKHNYSVLIMPLPLLSKGSVVDAESILLERYKPEFNLLHKFLSLPQDSEEDRSSSEKIIANQYSINKLTQLDTSQLGVDDYPLERGIYAFIGKDTGNVKYIGCATGRRGLRNRVYAQHLRANYLEKREKVFAKMDSNQLKKSMATRGVRATEKSVFRKNIARKYDFAPGEECVAYIKEKFYLAMLPLPQHSRGDILDLEESWIKQYQPEFNNRK